MSRKFLLFAPLLLTLASGCSHAEAQPSDDATGTGGGAGAAGSSAGAAGSSAGKAGAAGTAGSGTAGGGAAGASGSGTAGSTAGNAGSSGGKTADHLVINEVAYKSDSDPDDEYVEIFNPTGSDVSLSGHELLYASATGTGMSVWTGASGDTVKKGGYFVVGGTKFTGATDGKLGMALGAKGGSVTLTDGSKNVDVVGWGTSTTAEGTTAPADVGTSISRLPDGSDTEDNGVDFVVGQRTPGAKNAM